MDRLVAAVPSHADPFLLGWELHCAMDRLVAAVPSHPDPLLLGWELHCAMDRLVAAVPSHPDPFLCSHRGCILTSISWSGHDLLRPTVPVPRREVP